MSHTRLTDSMPNAKPLAQSDSRAVKRTSTAAATRARRKDELRDYLSKQKLVEKVVDISEKLSTLSEELEPLHIARLEKAANINLRLIDKYLPTLKSEEITGPDGARIDVTKQTVFVFQSAAPERVIQGEVLDAGPG